MRQFDQTRRSAGWQAGGCCHPGARSGEGVTRRLLSTSDVLRLRARRRAQWRSLTTAPGTVVELKPMARIRILLVDDHAIVRESLHSLLDPIGGDLFEVAPGFQAPEPRTAIASMRGVWSIRTETMRCLAEIGRGPRGAVEGLGMSHAARVREGGDDNREEFLQCHRVPLFLATDPNRETEGKPLVLSGMSRGHAEGINHELEKQLAGEAPKQAATIKRNSAIGPQWC